MASWLLLWKTMAENGGIAMALWRWVTREGLTD